MSYFVGTAKQTATTNAASYTLTLPDSYQTDDVLYAVLSQDGGGTTIAPDAAAVTAGWVIAGGAGGQAASGASRQVIALCRATSGAMTNPTFTGATDDWIGSCIPVRDVLTTWNLAALTEGVDYKRADWNAVNSAASAALTTPDDGRLLLYSWCADGTLQYMRCKLSEATGLDKYATSNISHIAAYKQQQAAGAAPSVTMYNVTATEGGNGWVIAFPNKSGGALQPDLRADITELQWHGSWAAQHDSITWQSPSNFAASINGITCSATAPTVSVSNAQAETPWGVSTQLASTENTASAWVGGTFAITSTNMTGKVFGVQFDVMVSTASALSGSEGMIAVFSDGTNWVAYQMASRANGWNAAGEIGGFVALGNATPYDSSGAIDWSAVTRRGYFVHRTGSSANGSGLFVRNSALFGTTALTGGGASRPATFNNYQTMMNSWGVWRWADLNASKQVTAKSSVQLGDGTNTTYFDGEAAQFEFPQAYSLMAVENWQQKWNVNSGQVGLFVKASASDTIKLSAGAAASENGQLLTIDAASSTSATYDFGQAFGGFLPTLKTGVPEVGATWTGCGKIDAKGASLTNCTVKNTTATDAAIAWTENGATVTGTTITVTSTTDYQIELGTAVTAITLTDVAFGGAAAVDKVHVLATTGTVTITISGTTSLIAADVTSAGATVVIAAPELYQSVTVSNLTAGSRVQIYDTTSSTELYNGVPAGTSVTWTDSVAAAASRAIRARISYVSGTSAKNFIESSIGTCGVIDGTEAVSYLANQSNDTTYNTNAVDGSTITGITFTDAATDLVNINLAAGSTTWPNIYAAFVYWISTAAGIADDIAYVDGVDPANYLLTAMKIKNTSSPSVPLTITGGFGRDATSGTIADIIDTTGGNIYPLVDHVVSKVVTVSGVNVITGDIADIPAAPSAATVAAEIVAHPKTLTVSKFVGLK